MKYFSVPSDFKEETIDKFCELHEQYKDCKVIETYGQYTNGTIISSGRITDVLPEIDFKRLESYVKYSKDRGVEFNYTLNPSCFGNYEFTDEGIKSIHHLLGELNSIGISSLTVSIPSLMELVNASGYDFDIKTSAICEITSPDKALFYKNLGVKRVVTDPDITRDFGRLENICKTFGDGVEIIINNVCFKNCPYKMYHYNHDAHCSKLDAEQTITDYYFNRCSMQKANATRNPIKINWIRPEDLKYYYEIGIHNFKIQGRQNVVTGDICKTVEHYFKEDFDGNLFDLITLFAPYNSFQPYIDNKKLDGYVEAFVKNHSFCKSMCSDCKYCDSYASKAMNIDKLKELQSQTKEFFTQYDKYSKVISEKEESYEPVKKLFDNQEMELDLSELL